MDPGRQRVLNEIQSLSFILKFSLAFVLEFTVSVLFSNSQSRFCSRIQSLAFVLEFRVSFLFSNSQSRFCSRIHSLVLFSNSQSRFYSQIQSCFCSRIHSLFFVLELKVSFLFVILKYRFCSCSRILVSFLLSTLKYRFILFFVRKTMNQIFLPPKTLNLKSSKVQLRIIEEIQSPIPCHLVLFIQ